MLLCDSDVLEKILAKSVAALVVRQEIERGEVGKIDSVEKDEAGFETAVSDEQVAGELWQAFRYLGIVLFPDRTRGVAPARLEVVEPPREP